MISRNGRWAALLLLFILVSCSAAAGHSSSPGESAPLASPRVITIPPEAQPSAHFDADAATNAYLAEIPPEAKARSDAYFEGGYWLILWDFLYGAVIALVLLNLRWSTTMRNLAERIARFKPVQTFLYWVEYFILTSIMVFPLTVYEEFFREHKYGLATQTFGPWMTDQLKSLGVGLVFGGIAVTLLFGIVRRLQRTWWIWGAIVSVVLLSFWILIAPVYIFPLFNTIKPLNDPKITQPILSMARANGIAAKDVYQIDASKQTTRMSANVSGFGKTMRITMNDNLLRRGSPEEIQSVMGHEMGHYVMNHIYKGILEYGVMFVIAFAFLHWGLDWSLKRWGEKWQIRGVGDTAVLPLALLLISVFSFVITPIDNTLTRTQEYEADMFGLNAARQPDGFAQAAIHLGEYRKMSPGPVEEWVFFDHPSGRNRIRAAMRWKAENLQLFSPPATSEAAPMAPDHHTPSDQDRKPIQ
jgi:STE24 endopeptidase